MAQLNKSIKITYYCEYPDGTAIWYAPDAEIKEGYTKKEERPMLYADEGKVIQLKNNPEVKVKAVWLMSTTADDWTEVDEDENKTNKRYGRDN